MRLAAFIFPQYAAMMQTDEMDFASMGERKRAIFCVIPVNDGSMNYLVSMLLTQCFQQLYLRADEQYNGRLPMPVRVIQDEWANVAQPDSYAGAGGAGQGCRPRGAGDVWNVRRKHMEIKINKEIRSYKETVYFGLTARQLICSLLAVGTAVGLYFALRGVLDRETLGWLCIVGAAPMAAAGFFHYNGLTLEQFLWAWCKTNFLLAGRRLWHSENYLYDLWEKEDKK